MQRSIVIAIAVGFYAATGLAATFTIEATANGVSFSAGGYTGTTSSASYDSAKDELTLLGSKDNPTILVNTKNGTAPSRHLPTTIIKIYPSTGDATYSGPFLFTTKKAKADKLAVPEQ